MKKNIMIGLMCFVMLFAAVPLQAAGEYVQLPKSDADRQTFLNSVTDSFATIGKSGKEKEKILRQRKDSRREERLRNQRRRNDAKQQKQIKKQERVIMDKVKAVDASRHKNKKRK